MSFIAKSQARLYLVTSKFTVIGVSNFQWSFHVHYEEFHLSYVILSIFSCNTISYNFLSIIFMAKPYLGKMSTKIMVSFIDTIFTRIWQNVRHAFGVRALTKSCFSKNQSYELLSPNRQYFNLLITGKWQYDHISIIHLVTCVEDGPADFLGNSIVKPSGGSFFPCIAGSFLGSKPCIQSAQVFRTDMKSLK